MKSAGLCFILFFGLFAGIIWAECPIPCPADLNGDCVVDLKDAKILSAYWLKECKVPDFLPVLKVVESGVSEEQAETFAQGLGINPDSLILINGLPQYLDPAGFQKVPTLPVTDQDLIQRLLKETEQDGEQQILFEAFNFDALAEIQPIPASRAAELLKEALGSADLMPEKDEFVELFDHSTFEAVDTNNQLILPAVQLDTRVNYQYMMNGYPILGPGSQLSVSFGPENQPTQMYLARRVVEMSDRVPLIQPQQAVDIIQQQVGNGVFVPEGPLNLVYYAPPLSHGNVQTLVPHFDVGGILYGPEGQQANKLRKLIPATADLNFVPQLFFSASAVRNRVTAGVDVQGGKPPYQYKWFSSSVDLNQFNGPDVDYFANPKGQEDPVAETVTVQVTDDNGIIVTAEETLQLSFNPPDENGVTILIGGVSDFGVERAVSDLCAANQAGFVNRFLAEGVQKRFNWSGTSAWERDFKEGGTGLDAQYVDNCDLTFYCGHGYGGGFTFESNQDDGYLTYTDAAGAWGDKDLEFLCLLSCQVLRQTYDSKSWAQRWGPAFDGLHLLCGFQTNAYDWPNFGPRFADYTLGRNFIFTTITLPVRSAWFQAKKEEQPSSVEAVVMGVVGPGGVISGYNDYFWGQGPVSPDIRGSNIRGYWRVVYK